MVSVYDSICTGDDVPISQKLSVGDVDMSSEETLNRVMDVVKEICQGDIQHKKDENPTSAVETESDSGQQKIRQVLPN